MSGIFISYIVPCFNVRNYLPKCIESLEKQAVSGVELEFVIINDGSTDDTLSLIRDFERRDNRVVVIDQSNQGVCAARNHGLDIAKGEYVFFLDGDDWLTDDASEAMYNFCRVPKPDIALFNHYKIQENHSDARVWVDCSKHISPGVYSKEEYIDKTLYFPISNKLYRREFLISNSIYFDDHLRTGEVYTFYIHSLVLSNTVGVSSDFVMYYLKRKGESATTSIDIKRDLSILDTLHTVNGYVDKYCSILAEKHSYLSSVFWLVTSFALIKYVGRTPYRKDLGQLISRVKKDEEYYELLKYFTGKGLSLSKHSLLALAIRFLPSRIAYSVIRGYYQFATRNIE